MLARILIFVILEGDIYIVNVVDSCIKLLPFQMKVGKLIWAV